MMHKHHQRSPTRYFLLVYAADRRSAPSAIPCLLSLGCCSSYLELLFNLKGFPGPPYIDQLKIKNDQITGSRMIPYYEKGTVRTGQIWKARALSRVLVTWERRFRDEKTWIWIKRTNLDLQKQPFQNIG